MGPWVGYHAQVDQGQMVKHEAVANRAEALAWWFTCAAAFWAANWVAYATRVGENLITSMWLPAGLTWGLLLICDRRRWVGVLLLSFVVQTAYGWVNGGAAWYWSLVFAGLDLAAMWLGVELVLRLRPRTALVATPGDLLWLGGFAGCVSVLSALVAAVTIRGLVPQTPYFEAFTQWLAGDMLSIYILVPWVLAWFGRSASEPLEMSRSRWIELAAIVGLSGLVLGWGVTRLALWDEPLPGGIYMAYPLLVWAGLRFDLRVVTSLLAAWAMVILFDLSMEMGAFWPTSGVDSLSAEVLDAQCYLSMTSLASLLLSVVSSERARRVVAMQANTQWFRAMAQTLRPALWLMELPSARLVYVSQAFERITGRRVGSVLGRSGAWREMVHQDDLPIVDASLKRMQEQGWDETEYRIVRPDGEVRWVHELSAAVQRKDGALHQLVGSVEDVTAKRHAAEKRSELEEQLRKSHERYQDFMRISGEGVWRAEFKYPVPIDVSFEEFMKHGGENAFIAECNEAFARLYELDSPDDVVGEPLGSVFRLRDPFNLEYLRRFHREGCRSVTSESRRTRDSGEERWFLSTFSGVVEDNKLVRLWGTLTDITELHRLNEQLRESQRMEAIGQLASGVAHDFNNLLTVISAHAELIQQNPDNRAGVKHSLEVVNEAVENAAGVSRSLLSFSKRLKSERRPVDLAEVIRQTQRMISRVLPSTVGLKIDLPDGGLPAVDGDAVQLQQVLLNLAINARDAMPSDGGTIHFLAEPCRMTRTAAPANGDGDAVEGVGVRLSVQDNGAGMTEQVRARVFEPFFSTKSDRGGTGLGLSVVKRIVEEHGGSIAVFSRLGQGSTFTIELPSSQDAAWAVASAPGAADRASANAANIAWADGRSILLAEDDPQIRGVIASSLSAKGFAVSLAADGPSLRRLYDDHVAAGRLPAALVSDIDMPGRTGIDVLREIRMEGGQLPAILMTGSVEFEIDPEVDGDTVLLNKPFSVSHLCGIVEERIRASSPEGQPGSTSP